MPEPIPFPIRTAPNAPPPDDAERRRALDPTRSFLVQAPAGSGKTHLLTQRFLRLLAQAERPDEIVAITFTIAAAAEMRNRILEALETAEAHPTAKAQQASSEDPLGIPALARAALARSHQRHWQLLEQPGQLRILTIDAFCRYLAMQAPLSWGLLSGLAALETTDQPEELYRRAARRLLERVVTQPTPSPAQSAVETLLLWRDNNWLDVEKQIVEMLAQRNRWYQDFVFSSSIDFPLLRERLEAPMRRAAHTSLAQISSALHSFPQAAEDLLSIARIACGNCQNSLLSSIAERPEIPDIHPDHTLDTLQLEDAVSAFRDLAAFLFTKTEKTWRKRFDISLGFPPGEAGLPLKSSIEFLLDQFREHPTLERALAAFLDPVPTAYTEDEWTLIRNCFTVLSQAYAELLLLFSETGQVDFTEISQIALRVLTPDPDPAAPSSFDHALRIADQIHHLLVDEFQDTSRNQHQLLARLIAAWPETTGRTCFCVGDPMQSIYGFRDAEVELFERLKTHGLDLPDDTPASDEDLPLFAAPPPSAPPEPFRFESATLQANFRTTPTLVHDLNTHFARILPTETTRTGPDDVSFTAAIPAREQNSTARTELHLDFTLSVRADASQHPQADPEITAQSQLGKIVASIRRHLKLARETRIATPNARYRIAVLGRTRAALVRVADALAAAQIPFRAVDVVPLRERPEILDALALARGYLNPADRRAWLGILRAPWCGLSLAELHALTSADDVRLLNAPIPSLLESRLAELTLAGNLSPSSAASVARLTRVLSEAQKHRAESAALGLGTWIESLWKALGGPATVNAEALANLRLLWATLDRLPSAEAGLLSAELDNALKRLYALPDPAVSSNFGVHLMTIHQSKGLEFEVVLLPELEAFTRSGSTAMISWLERGLPAGSSAPASELTEFLIAPIASKGAKAGDVRRWVDRIKRDRENREQRRLLYVAATRAREELHLFARPAFNPGSAGKLALGRPMGLLGTAWPAFKDRIEAEFESYKAAHHANTATTTPPLNLAASSSEPPPTRIYRLPAGFVPVATLHPPRPMDESTQPSAAPAHKDNRTPGSLYSRLQGIAIHAFLEALTRLRQTLNPLEASSALDRERPSVTALLRSRGLDAASAAAIARESMTLARQLLDHPTGSWILQPHRESGAESRWTGLVQSAGSDAILRHLRPDRVFFAPPPHGSGSSHESWWIIDYKTAQLSATDAQKESARRRFLETQRALHAPQLEAYAQLLRAMKATLSAAQIQVGLFYPRLLLFDSWPL